MTDPDAPPGRAGTAMKICNAVIAAMRDADDPVRAPRQRTRRMVIHLPVNERKPRGRVGGVVTEPVNVRSSGDGRGEAATG